MGFQHLASEVFLSTGLRPGLWNGAEESLISRDSTLRQTPKHAGSAHPNLEGCRALLSELLLDTQALVFVCFNLHKYVQLSAIAYMYISVFQRLGNVPLIMR